MITSTTPLRVSLFGGSTDNPLFIEKYGTGSVISFTCDLKTYATISQDVFGYNKNSHHYIINYSKREEVERISDIQNIIVRLVLDHFDIDPVMITLTSDIFSHGSGLASSSSYLISLIKAALMFKKMSMTENEICSLAYQLELKINPHCGLQDPYGCGIGGFKRMEFKSGNRVAIEFLPSKLFDMFDMHLIFTGITRDSRSVLEDVSKNIDKSLPLLRLVDMAYDALTNEKYELFLELMRWSWDEKKKTSSLIVGDKKLLAMDEMLSKDGRVIAHKLCGAGNGGFFLAVTEKNACDSDPLGIKISLFSQGVIGSVI